MPQLLHQRRGVGGCCYYGCPAPPCCLHFAVCGQILPNLPYGGVFDVAMIDVALQRRPFAEVCAELRRVKPELAIVVVVGAGAIPPPAIHTRW